MNGHYSKGYKPLDLLHAGSLPGVLDVTQRDRILRDPRSTLSFASFDPLTASGQGASLDFRKMSLDEDMYRPKRVVIETSPSGHCTWRFVPKAKFEGNVQDEGLWPRVIDICGHLVNCAQEQWDIYKLDPAYQCVVKPFPAVTTILPTQIPRARPPPPLRKRPHSSTSSSSTPTPTEAPTKKVHYDASVRMHSINSVLTDEESDEEQDEVEEMITDGTYHQRRPPQNPGKRFKPSSSKSDTTRMPSSKPVTQGPATPHPDPKSYHQPRQSQSVPPQSSKRKGEETLEPMDISHAQMEDIDDDATFDDRARKRAHFAAPSSSEDDEVFLPGVAQRLRQSKRREKEEQKRKRWEEIRQAKIRARENRLMEEIMADVPAIETETNSSNTTPISPDPEAARLAAIEESRRKLAELEADRPLWNAASKERTAREQAEEEERRRKAETKKQAEEQRHKAEREKQRQREREEEEKRRKEAQEREEVKAKVAKDREARRARWNSGKWTHRRAIERFAENSDYFEATKFSENHPLTVEDVPWPTLEHPAAFRLEDVDWASVENFYDVLKTHLRTQEYIAVVEKHHKWFHPDRWRGRNLLKAILDPEERGCMEVAATTVSQALTPIWQKVRAMKRT